jgi:hypothetical protein
MSKPKSMHTIYPMVSKRGSEPDPKPNYGRMFLHVGAAAIMVKGFTALSGLAVGKVVTPQVGFCNPMLELQSLRSSTEVSSVSCIGNIANDRVLSVSDDHWVCCLGCKQDVADP